MCVIYRLCRRAYPNQFILTRTSIRTLLLIIINLSNSMTLSQSSLYIKAMFLISLLVLSIKYMVGKSTIIRKYLCCMIHLLSRWGLPNLNLQLIKLEDFLCLQKVLIIQYLKIPSDVFYTPVTRILDSLPSKAPLI